jgi:hypothetical protein
MITQSGCKQKQKKRSEKKPVCGGEQRGEGRAGRDPGNEPAAALLMDRRVVDYVFGCEQTSRDKATSRVGLSHARDGYGVSPVAVGIDDMRLGAEQTKHRARNQLCTRVFSASPSLSRGQGEPELEMRMRAGVSTSGINHPSKCDLREDYWVSVSELDFDRFAPGVCAVPVEHIVPKWTHGGSSSRDISRSSGFRRALSRAERSRRRTADPALGDSHAFGGVSGAPGSLAEPDPRAWRRLVMRASPGFEIPSDGVGAGSGI